MSSIIVIHGEIAESSGKRVFDPTTHKTALEEGMLKFGDVLIPAYEAANNEAEREKAVFDAFQIDFADSDGDGKPDTPTNYRYYYFTGVGNEVLELVAVEQKNAKIDCDLENGDKFELRFGNDSKANKHMTLALPDSHDLSGYLGLTAEIACAMADVEDQRHFLFASVLISRCR